MTRPRLALLAAAAGVTVLAAQAAATTSTQQRANAMGPGVSTDWFTTTASTANHHADLLAIHARGFTRVVLRVRADRNGLAHGHYDAAATKRLLAALDPVLTDAQSVGLRPTIAFVDPPLLAHPTAAGLTAASSWWSAVASHNARRSAGVSFAVLTDAPALSRTTWASWASTLVHVARTKGGNGRPLIVGGDGPDPARLAWLPAKLAKDQHLSLQWDAHTASLKKVDIATKASRRLHVPVVVAWSPTPATALPFAHRLVLGAEASTIPFTALANTGLADTITYLTTPTPSPSSPSPTKSPSPSASPLPQLVASNLQLAQTHVIPAAGKSWTLTDGTTSTTRERDFAGNRSAVVLVSLSPAPVAPKVEGFSGSTSLGTVALNPPAQLPATEDHGPAYATDLWSATIPATWMKPGLQLRVDATNAQPSAPQPVDVGASPAMTLRVLPFYLFGASETTEPLSQTGSPDATTEAQVRAVWPASSVAIGDHPAGKVVFPTLVIGPRDDSSGTAQPAYVASSSSDYKDGFAAMGSLLTILGQMKAANGESPLDVQYYGPIIALNKTGQSTGTGGGLGSVGGGTGVGDTSYNGIFIHEQGHAFGLSHAGEAYDAHAYPYLWGSLNGSAWGWDPVQSVFLAPFIPTSADTYASCHTDTFAGHARAVDAQGRCVKQDPMQSGAGDQSSSHPFDTFSDYSTAVMQSWLEGKAEPDASFPSGYKTWSATTHTYVDASTATTSSGLYGLHAGFPVKTGVPVAAVTATVSAAGTAGATHVYPPTTFTGNLLQTIDPTSAADRAAIDPTGSGAAHWFCDDDGCDYSIRVTYADSSTRSVLFNGGFRSWFHPADAPPSTATDPLDSDSFRTFTVNVPADKTITKVELLSTPKAWTNPTPTVLATWTP